MSEAKESRRLTLNAASNFAASVWSALLNLAFVPFYVSFLGIEAYGLVGFYATLTAALAILDLGLRPTISREMARYSVFPEQAQNASDLARTLEVVYWIVAIIIGSAIVLSAGSIAHGWVQTKSIPVQTVKQAIVFMGIIAAIQWPVSFYTGGLQGLQNQVLLNAINILISSVRFIGAALVVSLVSPTIVAFFSWQIFVSSVQIILFLASFWYKLPKSQSKPHFRSSLLVTVWRFAAGMWAISTLSLVLTQSDRLLLSRMLPLDEYGYYVLASMLAQSLLLLSGPVTNAVFPRFTQLISHGGYSDLTTLFHRTCQSVSIGVLPIGLTLAIFSSEITLAWTHNPDISQQISLLVSLLTLGTLLLTLQTVPYTIALAYGWTKLNVYLGIISVALIIPLLYVLVNRFGAIGGGIAWLVLNGCTLPPYIHFLYKRLLPGEEKRWYLKDVGLPLIASLLPLLFGRFLLSTFIPTELTILVIPIYTIAALFAAALAVPFTRNAFMGYIWQPVTFRSGTR